MSVEPASSRPSTASLAAWQHDCGRLSTEAHVSRFQAPDGVDEYHLVIRPTEYAHFTTQLDWLQQAYEEVRAAYGLGPGTALFRRFFCSDLPNQAVLLKAQAWSSPTEPEEPCGVSWVGQPPEPPAKVVLWAWHTHDPTGELDKRQRGTTMSLRRGDLTHHFTAGLISTAKEASYEQTWAVFGEYEAFLAEDGLRLADHVIRTWLFVQNVDANYKGLVLARRRLFEQRGLTATTHYIASTGIEGIAADVAAKLLLDAYAIGGVRPEQIAYLEALDHLCPTGIYGVTFERATAVSYRDRKHVFMSGTASIDHNGYILHPGDVERQLDRALENVAALLKPAGATLDDMAAWTVYLRDPSDVAATRAQMRDRCGAVPMAVVVAPVCRPGWLVEIEGIAVIPQDAPDLPPW